MLATCDCLSFLSGFWSTSKLGLPIRLVYRIFEDGKCAKILCFRLTSSSYCWRIGCGHFHNSAKFRSRGPDPRVQVWGESLIVNRSEQLKHVLCKPTESSHCCTPLLQASSGWKVIVVAGRPYENVVHESQSAGWLTKLHLDCSD